jgi:hypothetical protein
MSRAILFRCHYLNSHIVDVFRRIQEDCTGDDVFLLYDGTKNPIASNSPNVFSFTDRDISTLNYPLTDLWYNSDYPLLLFYKFRPEYKYYWQIEYDVRFTGNWLSLIDHACECDFLGTHVARYASIPDWNWWKEQECISVDKQLRVKSLFALLRFSNRALNVIDYHRSHGARGFCEWLVPTILNSSGCSISDIGGQSEFTPQDYKGRFYSPTTFDWRPVMKQAGPEIDWLFHPVRESLEVISNGVYHIGDIDIHSLPPMNKSKVNTGCSIIFDSQGFYFE